MMRVWEVPVFFGAALALHAAAFLAIPGKGQDGAPGGDGGTATVTVAAASPQLAAMVEAWETPPDVAGPPVPEVTEAPAPAAPARPEVATAPPPAAVPEPPVPAAPMAADLPDLPGLPQMPEDRAAEPEPEPEPENVAEAEPDVEAEAEAEAEPEPEPPTALAEAERPAPRPAEMAAVTPPADPEPQPERAAPSPQEAQPELRAAGTAGGEARGQAGQAEVATASPGQQADLMATWGAQIQERLQRALVYPRQAQMRRLTGAATVALTVGADGRVQGRRLVASSGSPILDEAALSTVDRARGIPQAPQALGGGSFTFQLPVRFDGR